MQKSRAKDQVSRSGSRNRFGLSRYIAKDIALKIRQEAGFGCVICGNGIFTYEHIFPEFADAHVHDPKKMTLLCHQCAGKHTRRQLSKETIWSAKVNPYTRSSGYSFERFDFGTEHPKVQIGPVLAINCDSIIEIRGQSVVKIEKAISKGQPYRVSAIFRGLSGEILCEIKENEWRAPSDAWDIQFVGQKLEIISKISSQKLIIITHPPNGLEIEELNMIYDGQTIRCNNKKLTIETLSGHSLETETCRVRNCKTAISIDDNHIAFGLARQDGGIGSLDNEVYFGKLEIGSHTFDRKL